MILDSVEFISWPLKLRIINDIKRISAKTTKTIFRLGESIIDLEPFLSMKMERFSRFSPLLNSLENYNQNLHKK